MSTHAISHSRAADVAPALVGPVRARMAQAYAHVGRDLFNSGHYPEAETELDRYVESSIRNACFFVRLDSLFLLHLLTEPSHVLHHLELSI